MKTTNEALHFAYTSDIDPEELQEMIAERAFRKAEKRGFEPGHEMADWLEAEQEVSNQCRYWSQG